jgi:hypothetical protein
MKLGKSLSMNSSIKRIKSFKSDIKETKFLQKRPNKRWKRWTWSNPTKTRNSSLKILYLVKFMWIWTTTVFWYLLHQLSSCHSISQLSKMSLLWLKDSGLSLESTSTFRVRQTCNTLMRVKSQTICLWKKSLLKISSEVGNKTTWSRVSSKSKILSKRSRTRIKKMSKRNKKRPNSNLLKISSWTEAEEKC